MSDLTSGTRPSREDLAAWSQALETGTAQDILTWAAGQFPEKITFATGLGIEGCAIIDMVARHSLPIDIFTLDTGLLFPETYDLWSRLESRYGITIRSIRPQHTVEEQGRLEGPELWKRDPDRCCDLRKTLPLRGVLTSFDAWISAIRRDQTPDRADAPAVGWDGRFGLVKVNPLIRWTFADVEEYIRQHDVPVNVLHEQGYPSIGCMPCTTAVAAGEDPRAGRWRGREKTECGLHILRPTKV